MAISRTMTVNTLVTMLLALAFVASCGDEPHTGEVDTSSSPPDRIFPDDPSVPQTCAEVELAFEREEASSVGCQFYSVSMDATYPSASFAIVLANVNFSKEATFTIFGSEWDFGAGEGAWKELLTGTIDPLGQRIVDEVTYIAVNNNPELYKHPELYNAQAVLRKGAYKIVSDVPIVAYQFNPLQKTVASADASMLIPVTSWDTNYQVVGYKTVRPFDAAMQDTYVDMHLAYFTVVAWKDGTEVTITPNTRVRAGFEKALGDDELFPNTTEPFSVTLDESDVLFVHSDLVGASLTGTLVTSNKDHPIGLWTGHQCALIPDYAGACDNIEEQLPGTRFWGKEFVAARYANRNDRVNHTDPVMWQIYASEDKTTVEFTSADSIKGIGMDSVELQQGESVELYVYGGVNDPGDFFIKANRPIAVLQYMTGALTTINHKDKPLDLGDPAVSYVPPVDQFLSRYLVNIPNMWEQDYLIITKTVGKQVLVDGEIVDDALFRQIPGTQWEVGRILTADGARIIETSNDDFGVGLTVVGFDAYDSYAYTGGMGFRSINIPE